MNVVTSADAPPRRIATLDIVRGIAVMGILAMNIVGFALPFQAYMNPAALGPPDTADTISWGLSFVLIDGKMRGLFSFLFGASMLLVIERAEAAGGSPASTHYRRMIWLLGFGLIHFYLIWFGDILVGYALIGMVAYLFRNKEPQSLIAWACGLLLVQFLILAAMTAAMLMLAEQVSAPGAPLETVKTWQQMERMFGTLSGAELDKVLGLFRGSYTEIFHHRLTQHGSKPFTGLPMFGWETLAYMLLGMAALKSGFLTGAWRDRDYRRIMLVGFGIGIPAYAFLAWGYARSGFALPMTFAYVMAATVPFRPLMILATASLIILVTRQSGALTARIAAAGRAAFTNAARSGLTSRILCLVTSS